MSPNQVETLGSCIRLLKVEVPPDRVKAEIDKQFKALSKGVAIPGFRKGKAPKSEVKRRFGKHAEQEAIRSLIEESFPDAVTEQKLEPVSQPVIEEAEIGEGSILTYSAKIEVMPEIDVKDYKSISLNDVPEAKVEDEEIEHQIGHTLEHHATLVPVEGERPLENGDHSLIDFEGSIDGVPFEGGKGEGMPLEIGSGRFIPGFEEGMIGMKLGETRDVEVTFPEEYQEASLQGKAAVFKVTLKELKAKEIPEFNEDFVLSHTEEESVEAYREKVRGELMGRKEEERKRELKKAICESLRNANPTDLPESLVAYEAEQLTRNMAYQLTYSGMPKEQLGELLSSQREQTFEAAKERVHNGLLLRGVGEKEGVEVSDEDVEKELERLGEQSGQGAEAIRDQFERNNQIAALRDRLFEEKVYDFIIESGLSKIVKP